MESSYGQQNSRRATKHPLIQSRREARVVNRTRGGPQRTWSCNLEQPCHLQAKCLRDVSPFQPPSSAAASSTPRGTVGIPPAYVSAIFYFALRHQISGTPLRLRRNHRSYRHEATSLQISFLINNIRIRAIFDTSVSHSFINQPFAILQVIKLVQLPDHILHVTKLGD